MNLVYLLFSILTIFYIIFSKRNLDFITVFIFSLVIYSFPMYFGETLINNEFYPINSLSILSNIVFLFGALIGIIFIDKLHIIQKKTIYNYDNNNTMFIISLITLLLMLYSMSHYGNILGAGSFNKVELLSDNNRIIEYFKYFALFNFIYAFTNNGKYVGIIRGMSLVSIGYTFILGHRSFLIIGLISIIFNYLIKNNAFKNVWELILHNKTIIIICIIILAATFIVKNITAALFSGQFDLVLDRLSDTNYYFKSFFQSEPNSIVSNINNIVNSNLKYSLISYILYPFLCIIPVFGNYLINNLNLVSFEYLLNYNFNLRFSQGYGVGSTIIGEAYATGSFLLVFIIGFVLVLLIGYLNKKIYVIKSPLLKTYILCILPYFSFYFYRNSLPFLTNICKSYLIITLFCLFINLFVKNKKIKLKVK